MIVYYGVQPRTHSDQTLLIQLSMHFTFGQMACRKPIALQALSDTCTVPQKVRVVVGHFFRDIRGKRPFCAGQRTEAVNVGLLQLAGM